MAKIFPALTLFNSAILKISELEKVVVFPSNVTDTSEEEANADTGMEANNRAKVSINLFLKLNFISLFHSIHIKKKYVT